METASKSHLQETITLKAELVVALAKNPEDAALGAAQKLLIAKLKNHIDGEKSE